MRRFLHRLIALLLTGFWLATGASAHEVAVVMSQDGGPYAAFADTLKAATRISDHRLHMAGSVDSGIQADVLERTDVVIAVGAAAFDAVARRVNRPVLGVLLSQAQFDAVRRELPAAQLSAIVLDQPPSRQMALIRGMLPEARRIGLLLGPNGSAVAKHYQDIAAQHDLRLYVEEAATHGELLTELDRVLRSSDALLTQPDPVISSPAAARAILLASYRYRRPVFAYSQAYVEAGALAAVYSTPGDIARDVAAWINASESTGKLALPAVRAAAGFDIAINHQVARALNLSLPDEATLRERIAQGEQP